MDQPSLVASVSTFVIRLRREWSVVGPSWRGRVDHVQSGESAAFLGPDGLLDFLRRFGVMAEDESRPAKKDE